MCNFVGKERVDSELLWSATNRKLRMSSHVEVPMAIRESTDISAGLACALDNDLQQPYTDGVKGEELLPACSASMVSYQYLETVAATPNWSCPKQGHLRDAL